MRSFCVIPQALHKVVQHLVRIYSTLTSDYYGAVPLSRKRSGKTREMPGFSVNLDFFTALSKLGQYLSHFSYYSKPKAIARKLGPLITACIITPIQLFLRFWTTYD